MKLTTSLAATALLAVWAAGCTDAPRTGEKVSLVPAPGGVDSTAAAPDPVDVGRSDVGVDSGDEPRRTRFDVVGGGASVRRHVRRTMDGEREVVVELRERGEREFAFRLILDAGGRITDYALAFDGLPPHRWVHHQTGAVLLPKLSRDAWISEAFLRDDDFSGEWLGRRLTAGREDTAGIAWSSPRVLRLNPDATIATSRDIRDDGTGRQGDADWTYVRLTADDYARMIDAGFNLFRIQHADWPMVRAEPVFIVTEGMNVSPALPLHPAYCGAVMYTDEPAIRLRGEDWFRALRTPAEAAAGIRDRTRETLAGDGKYGRGFLRNRLDAYRVHWGDLPRYEYPIWEAVASAAWYELEAGADSFCFESRNNPASFAEDVRRVLGVDFPATVEASLDLHFAVLRGAARHHDADWGVSVYGQCPPEIPEPLLTRAYDQGARFFWHWTSDHGHHVEFEEQLRLSRVLREHERAHPRRSEFRADVALVMPWGYALDDETVRARREGRLLWAVPNLKLLNKNETGTSHRDVLAAAAGSAVRLLEEGASFDVLFLRDEERARGYERVIRIGRDARRTERGR